MRFIINMIHDLYELPRKATYSARQWIRNSIVRVCASKPWLWLVQRSMNCDTQGPLKTPWLPKPHQPRDLDRCSSDPIDAGLIGFPFKESEHDIVGVNATYVANRPSIILEILTDSNKQIVEHGVPGRVIITDLTR